MVRGRRFRYVIPGRSSSRRRSPGTGLSQVDPSAEVQGREDQEARLGGSFYDHVPRTTFFTLRYSGMCVYKGDKRRAVRKHNTATAQNAAVEPGLVVEQVHVRTRHCFGIFRRSESQKRRLRVGRRSGGSARMAFLGAASLL